MKAKSPLISVIMPVYNGGRFLRQAIDSILAQTYPYFELIIINDGSTDNTETIILSYDDKRIRYVKNEHNLKLIKTLNKGLALAKGKYISRMDADDIAEVHLFEEQISAFNDNSIDIVNIFTYELSEDGLMYRLSPRVTNFAPEALKYIELFENQITHPGIMVRASRMKHYAYKDDGTVTNFEDVDLWIRMLYDGCKCFTLGKRLLFYRINASSVTRTVGTKRNILRTKYLAKVLNDILGINVSSDILYYIYGDISNNVCKPNEISSIFKQIERKLETNDVAKNQFRKWWHLRMLVVSLQLIKKHRLKYKIKVITFLIKYSSYLFEKTSLEYFRFRLSNKWIKYESFNVG